jgi:hypothetical protein
MAKNKEKTADDKESKQVECAFIKSHSEHGFRRCGISFTREGAYFDIELFDGGVLELLMHEPNLSVTPASVEESALVDPKTL